MHGVPAAELSINQSKSSDYVSAKFTLMDPRSIIHPSFAHQRLI